MNREMRLELISQMISEQEIKTQEELQQLLLAQGLHVTQATISRDIHTLQLIKVPGKDGSLKYCFQMDRNHLISEKLRHKLRDALVSMEVIQLFVVVKTLPGHAHAFGVLLDSLDLEGKAGTLCGNDTCLIICRSMAQAENIKKQLDYYSK
ncbi:arginine repressor [Bacillus sp. BRMEA1]|uniref:arginine repressor n=1 Tax=Neobacillus endophyticus TaxID=2738405 RepID=UPI0015671874|nr:arginine repressor [Neobacillus endophyticus]NRD76453.1 arginine repressor [Neobacillus endophyticus]